MIQTEDQTMTSTRVSTYEIIGPFLVNHIYHAMFDKNIFVFFNFNINKKEVITRYLVLNYP